MDDQNALLPLTPAVFHILLVLCDGELHGYGIMQRIKSMTSGTLNIGPGTLYRSIKQMLDQNLIAEAEEASRSQTQRRTTTLLSPHRIWAARRTGGSGTAGSPRQNRPVKKLASERAVKRRQWLDFSVRIYSALLILYPRSFREGYAEPMIQLFRDRCRRVNRPP